MSGIYAEPRTVDGLEGCAFYHTTELPGYGVVEGEWDLRGREHAYLGGIAVAGRRVLEVGTASGHLCFFLERQGADVVAYDLSPEHDVDVVPYARGRPGDLRAELREHVRRLNNAYWLGHAAHASRARLAHGTVYDVPAALGTFDVATVGCVLLHLRDPFLALQNVAARTAGSIVVTETAPPGSRLVGQRLVRRVGAPVVFRPRAEDSTPPVTWWTFTPATIARMLAVLGFERGRVTHHTQQFRGAPRRLFTVVAERTHGAPGGGD